MQINKINQDVKGAADAEPLKLPPPIGNAYVKAFISILHSNLPIEEEYICIDNGAQRTIASDTFAKRIFGQNYKDYMMVDPKLPKLKGVTGHSLEVEGILPMQFTFGTYTISHPVMVYKAKEDICLLGNDVIIDKINYEKGRFLSFGQGHEKVPIQYNLPTLTGIVKSTQVIPPRTTKICTITASEMQGNPLLYGREVVISKKEGTTMGQGLVMEHSMSNVDQNGTAKVMIINNSDELVNVHRGTAIADIEFVSPTNELASGMQVTTDEQEYEEIVRMIHEAEERKEVMDGIGEMFPQPHGVEAPTSDDREWIDKVKHDHLTIEEWNQLKTLLLKRADAFAKSDDEMGLCNYFKASLPVKDNTGFLYLKPRPLPHGQQAEADKVVTNLLKLGIIRQSKSPHATNIVCVKRKATNGVIKTRVCVDLRLQNCHAIPNRFPNMQLDEAMTKIGHATYRTSLDFKNGFHQIALDEESIPYTAFHCNGVLYEYVRVPFGHVSAMGIWCNVMALLCKGYKPSTWYADDAMVCTVKKIKEKLSQAFSNHLDDLDGMFERIINAGLKLNPEKCEFAHHCSKPMDWLGFTMEKALLKPQESKVEAIKNFERPATKKQAESFVSLASFYRRFIKSFARIAKPIYAAIHAEPFEWTQEAEKAFQTLKESLCSSPVLMLPKLNKPFQIWTDASGHAIGAVLTQLDEQSGKMHPIAYASRKFNAAELKLSSPCKELLAIIYALTTWNMYICSMPCTVYSDCRAWVFMKMKEGISSRVSRLALLVLEYDLDVKYVQGSKNLAADGLSRQYDAQNVRLESPSSLTDPKLELLRAPPIDESIKLTEYLHLCENYIAEFEQNVSSIKMTKLRNEINYVEEILSVSPVLHADLQDAGQDDQPFTYSALMGLENKEDVSLIERVALITLKEHLFSIEGFQAMQQADKKLRRIFKRVERGDGEENGYFLNKGILMKETTHEDGRKLFLLCIPSDMKQQILSHYHGSLIRGHLGPRRLHLHLKNRFHWDNMKKDVQEFYNNCINCQYNAKHPVSFNKGTVITPKYPNHIVHIDLMVGLPRSTDGYFAMLLCYDGFSRFSYGIPLRSEKSDYIIKLFYQFYVAAFGIPWALHGDNAKNISNETINYLSKILGIKKAVTPIYNPKSNPCETLCGVLGDLLRKHLNKNDQKYWSLLVPMLLQSINNTTHTQTGYTPASLMLGRFIENDMIPLVAVEDAPQNSAEYVVSLRRFQEYSFRLTRYKHQQLAEKHKREMNKTSKPHKFVEGDFVMIKELQPAGKGELKLRNKYRGPFRIIKAYESSLVVIPWLDSPEKLQMQHNRGKMRTTVQHEIVPVSICKPYKREVTKPIDFDERFMQKLLDTLGNQVDIDLSSVISQPDIDDRTELQDEEMLAPPGAEDRQEMATPSNSSSSSSSSSSSNGDSSDGDELIDEDEDDWTNEDRDDSTDEDGDQVIAEEEDEILEREEHSSQSEEQQGAGYQTPPNEPPDGAAQEEEAIGEPYRGLEDWLANLEKQAAIDAEEHAQQQEAALPLPVMHPTAATGAIAKDTTRKGRKTKQPQTEAVETPSSKRGERDDDKSARRGLQYSPQQGGAHAAALPSTPAWHQAALQDDNLTEEEREMLRSMTGSLARSPVIQPSHTSGPFDQPAERRSPRIAGRPKPDYTTGVSTRSHATSKKLKVSVPTEIPSIVDKYKGSKSKSTTTGKLNVEIPKAPSIITDLTKTSKGKKSSIFGFGGSQLPRTPP